MKNLTVCDMHCDTLTKAFDKKKSLFSNSLNVNLKNLNQYHSYTQFFAVFISPQYYSNPKKRCFDVINYMYNQIHKNHKKITICKNLDDINKAISDNKISALLSIEGGEAIKELDDLELFYDLGIRMLTLTWNFDNHIAGTNGSNVGLSLFGKSVIKKMNKLGIIIDLSHSSIKTFFDVLEITDKPVVLSHSNSYTICPHQRNITDEQFKVLKQNNGCVGINFYPDFLTNSKKAEIFDIVAHIEYFLSLGGEDNISIGSDFDGIDYIATGIKSPTDVYKIFNLLSQRGISDEVIEKIAYKNIYRIIGICL